MKTSLYRIITKDNLELVGLLYEPEIKTEKILVHVHGMAGNFYENKFIDYIAQTLTNNSIALFVCNNRGAEYLKDIVKVENNERKIVRVGETYDKFEDCTLDIEAGINFVESLGYSKIHLSGHSLGSPKIAYYFTKTNDVRLSSMIFLSPADMLGLARADKEIFKQNIEEAESLIREGKDDELLSRQVWDEYPISAKSYISLFTDDSKASIFNFYNPEDKFETLRKITCPVLAIAGNKDDALVIPTDEAMKRISKVLINNKRVETKILGNADHLYNNYEQDLANTITSWIQKI